MYSTRLQKCDWVLSLDGRKSTNKPLHQYKTVQEHTVSQTGPSFWYSEWCTDHYCDMPSKHTADSYRSCCQRCFMRFNFSYRQWSSSSSDIYRAKQLWVQPANDDFRCFPLKTCSVLNMYVYLCVWRYSRSQWMGMLWEFIFVEPFKADFIRNQHWLKAIFMGIWLSFFSGVLVLSAIYLDDRSVSSMFSCGNNELVEPGPWNQHENFSISFHPKSNLAEWETRLGIK